VANNSVTVRVPAKVNLQFSVGPRESDGFHNLVSVFQAISIFDDVTVSKSHARVAVSRSLSQASTPTGFQKTIQILAVKAALLVGSKFDFAVDVHIEVKKSIPVAGGMAGGSADAAATLIAMDSLFQLEMSREELHALGSATWK
jgi:4-diphosphocytidyl-2-C-methyl-D-erythritol kinase